MKVRRVFRPPVWATLLTAAGTALFASLGGWQVQRGQAKAELRAHYAAPGAATPLEAAAGNDTGVPRAVVAEGTWLGERSLLQDGQSHEGRPGYHVWTPLRLASGPLVLVNRGWVAGPGYELAPPEGPARVTGLWRSLPEPGLRLEATRNCPRQPVFPLVVLYPTPAELACVLGEPVLAGLLLLDPAEANGFVRAWSMPGLAPERHYAYAVQWFALAATTVILYLVLNLKRP